MSNANLVSARLDPETLQGLDRLADYHERSRAWLIAKAVSRFVEEESRFFAFLEEGADAIRGGDCVTHEELLAEIKEMARQKRAA